MPRCDHKRIAEIAARVEREDPDWRQGNPVFQPPREPDYRWQRHIIRKTPRPVVYIAADGTERLFPGGVPEAVRALGVGESRLRNVLANKVRKMSDGATIRYAEQIAH